MNKAPVYIPAIIEQLNPVREQFAPVSNDSGQMQIPDAVGDVPRFVYQLLTDAEQEICDSATD